jgi:site-specific DNA-adenine methylase
MPFAYYGAKHGLAKKYPRPQHRVIVEPFAGSAAYSVHHARYVDRVILIDADPAVVDLWNRVKAMTTADLDDIGREVMTAERTTDPLIGGIAGGTQLRATLAGLSRQITPRMRDNWPKVQRRIKATLPHLHKFDIALGTYADAPDIDATWHIDPPYMAIMGDTDDSAGNAYRHGAGSIDFDALADWCRSRRGLVMVCEQSPATWLPFYPLARQTNGASASGSTRTEVIWRNDLEQPSLWGAA